MSQIKQFTDKANNDIIAQRAGRIRHSSSASQRQRARKLGARCGRWHGREQWHGTRHVRAPDLHGESSAGMSDRASGAAREKRGESMVERAREMARCAQSWQASKQGPCPQQGLSRSAGRLGDEESGAVRSAPLTKQRRRGSCRVKSLHEESGTR